MSSKKAEARERVKAMREEQARQDRKRERIVRFGIAASVLAAVAIIVVAVAASRDGNDGPSALPSTVTEQGGGVLVGDPDAPVTIDSWVDFLCPHCKEFEDANGATIDELVAAGEANVVYHPLTFTGGTYSTRANNAFACAADEGKAGEFLAAAFVNPQQWTRSSLVDLGDSVGIGGSYESCVQDGTYDDWSRDVTATASENEITGTPTIFINGELLPQTSWSPEGISAAVAAAATGGSLSTPAPGASGAPSEQSTPGATP